MAPTPSPAILDAETYPHILRSILASAAPSTLLTLRSVSRSLHEAVDTRLSRHVLLWASGRVSSRLCPSQRLPRPLPELGDHVRVIDIQTPPLGAKVPPALVVPVDSDDESPSLTPAASVSTASVSTASAPASRCACGWSEEAPQAHLAILTALPYLETVRRWGPHTCWAPAATILTHFDLDSSGGTIPDDVMWYIHSPASTSRFNRIDLPFPAAGEARYIIAGARTQNLFDMIDALSLEEEMVRADAYPAQPASSSVQTYSLSGDRGTSGKGWEGREGRASKADCFAALLAMFWLEEDEEGSWTLVDVEAWPTWRGEKDVAATIRDRVRRCCVHADWDAEELAALESRLRSISAEEYRVEVGREVAALEEDDHGWRFD